VVPVPDYRFNNVDYDSVREGREGEVYSISGKYKARGRHESRLFGIAVGPLREYAEVPLRLFGEEKRQGQLSSLSPGGIGVLPIITLYDLALVEDMGSYPGDDEWIRLAHAKKQEGRASPFPGHRSFCNVRSSRGVDPTQGRPPPSVELGGRLGSDIIGRIDTPVVRPQPRP
jgi:hypothetical protein